MDSKPTQPFEIAREVLKQLATRRQQPTPDNYLNLYNEIAGDAAVDIFPDKPIKSLIASLPRKTTEQTRRVRQFEAAATARNWGTLGETLQSLFEDVAAEPLPWAAVIRELLSQLDHSREKPNPLDIARRRETLERLLKSATTPEQLHVRLQSLIKTWMQEDAFSTSDEGETTANATNADAAAKPDKNTKAGKAALAAQSDQIRELGELIALLLDNSVATLLADHPELAEEASALAGEVCALHNPKELEAYKTRLRKFSYRLQFTAEDQAEMRTALLHLLRLVIENINELVIDDRPLRGQITLLNEIVSQPLSLRRLDDAERRLKDVIFKQGMLKKQLNEAQNRLKSMLATFVDRLADMDEETGAFHTKIGLCAQKIGEAGDINKISEVLDEVMTTTRTMQTNAQLSRKELQMMRLRVEETEREIERLQVELAQVSEMVRQDPLTGALNRKGMEEALDREVARFQRQKSQLCLAILDIDNFKILNDTLGHQAGDAALVHLTNVIRETIRPQDTLARYGGEEFVILLPGTPLDESVSVMVRLQRELTRRFFMHNNEKLLITFSAGVAELTTSEPPKEALKRADNAMYLAKRSGKNRVIPA